MTFPLIRQHDSMQCGIACLQMLCLYYGRHVQLQDMERICHATTEGVSLLGISQAAERLDFKTISAKVGLDAFEKENLPCLLHWNQNHFVVLYRVRRGRFYVADPAKGLMQYGLDEFKQHWMSLCSEDGKERGIAMFLEPTEKFKKHQVAPPYEDSDGNDTKIPTLSFSTKRLTRLMRITNARLLKISHGSIKARPS